MDINWDSVWAIYDVIRDNDGWMNKIKKDNRKFYDILPAACRIAKVKLNEEERLEVLIKITRVC